MTGLASHIMAALLTVAAVTAGSALAGTAQSTKIVPFTATYAGHRQRDRRGRALDHHRRPASARARRSAISKLTGKGAGCADENAECNPFNGTGSMTGAEAREAQLQAVRRAGLR